VTDLDGQVALVTGGGRGIGRAIALELAGLGAHVAVTDLHRTSVEETAVAVRGLGRKALAVVSDVTRATDREGMVRQTLAEFGALHVLVNNAGIYRSAVPLDVTEDHWDMVLGVNAKAVLFCTLAALPTMLAAKRGVVVSVASMAGKVPTPTAIPYGVSKSAVISITRSLAMAYAHDGIRFNCVCPGLVDTEMWAQIDREVGVGMLGKQPGEYWRERTGQIPLGRGEQPEDVARVVGFLASDRSAYMTGQAINVTGGLIMH
jgi:NAD(P)-dependent dehydrogenase (short-subunit alcohol dehydrogenase family)